MFTRRRRQAAWWTVLTVALWAALVPALPAYAVTTITVDGGGAGRRFDGVGAVSGGGGTSRLLPDYPPTQRNQILDYLFRPNFGASLHMLKVEIGGDENSTNGSEASHQRTPTDQNYQRGYEWWLMKEAKARNPNISLHGLEWGAPGWFNGGVGGPAGFFSQDNINYLLNWIRHAQSDHGLRIDTIGGWNESNVLTPYGAHHNWFIQLKNALVNNGLPTKLVAFDATGGDLSIGNSMRDDPQLRAAVDVMGIHYPCQNISQPAIQCLNTSVLQQNGKPIWASEHGSQNFNTGAPQLARAINRDYIDSRITAIMHWNLVTSYYRTVPHSGNSLMVADQPWSGAFQLGKQIWVMAHTAQFAQPGWQYLNGASGYLEGNRTNGSFVTLKSPNGSDWSSIVETTTATASQTATYRITGGLSTGTVRVWRTSLGSTNPANDFARQADITPVNGSFTITFQPNSVYSLTTTTGQAKGTIASPPRASLALPYSDNFDGYPVGKLARYMTDFQGGFETAACGGGRTGGCVRQVINRQPIAWPIGSNSRPATAIGDPDWANYRVDVDALLEQTGSVDVVGRLQMMNQFGPGASSGYHFRATSGGNWSLFRENNSGTVTTLASGTRAFGLNTFHRLSLSLNGSAIEAFIDNVRVASVSDSTYRSGNIGLLVSKWQNAQFDNFSVTPTTGSPTVITVDDSIQGTGTNQFNYQGSGWQHCSNCGANLYNGTNSWNNVTGQTVTVAFNGRQITFFGVRDPQHGIGAVSIDGGPETTIDFYSATRAGNQAMFTSPTLAAGTHTFRLRVTGTRNPSSSNTFVVPDRVDILS
ncbi:MAG TPA: galactosylceramidase [Pilimelia sp.]|nr:galactosylceramidase [Pilimelia sp.]